MVYDGPERSPLGHKFVTSGTNRAQHLSPAAKAISLTEQLGTPDCRLFRKKIFDRHPQLSYGMASSYLEIAKAKGYIDANRTLLDLNQRLTIKDLNLSATPDEIKHFAQEKALIATGIAESFKDDIDGAYAECSAYVTSYGLTPTKSNKNGDFLASCVLRMCCPRWWKRSLFTLVKRTLESVARDLGLVQKKSAAYSSKITQGRRANQKQLAKQFLENTFLVNDNQQVFSLKELSETSVSNPEIRRAELMIRIAGFELVADQLGHCGEFYTITTPSRMHARLNKTGQKNPKYDGTNPRKANEYLGNVWAKIRAKLHRENLNIYGFHVAEPNHDGTPHWHLLLFMSPAIKTRVRAIMKHYALQDSSHERGANKHRFTAIPIDKSKGSAAGYIAKYITKNIDGSDLDTDLYGNDAKDSAKAIDAWASCWGIRQFQQVGGPSVTVWRELRRLSQSDTEVTELEGSQTIVSAAFAAASSDWAAYVMLMGGVHMRKIDRPFKPLYEEVSFIDFETGELLETGLTAYGDPKKPRIKGLDFSGQAIVTRHHNWKKYEIDFDQISCTAVAAGAQHGPSSAADGPRAQPAAARRPWTSINNCTQPPIH